MYTTIDAESMGHPLAHAICIFVLTHKQRILLHCRHILGCANSFGDALHGAQVQFRSWHFPCELRENVRIISAALAAGFVAHQSGCRKWVFLVLQSQEFAQTDCYLEIPS